MARWVVFLAIIAGCGHAAPPPPSSSPAPVGTTHAAPADAAAPPALEDDLPRLAGRAVKFYADWQHIMEATSDCATAAAKITALADANADFITANTHIMRGGHDKVVQMRAALEPHAAELDASAKAIVQSPTMAACHEDATFAHAIDRIQGDS